MDHSVHLAKLAKILYQSILAVHFTQTFLRNYPLSNILMNQV